MNKLFIGVFLILSLFYNCCFAEAEKNRSVVIMFGETHAGYRADNDLVISLLSELKKRGFNYLALETVAGVKIELNDKLKKYIKGIPLNLNDFLHGIKLTDLEYKMNQIFEEYVQGIIKRNDILAYWQISEQLDSPGYFDLIDAAKKARMKIVLYDPSSNSYRSFNQREQIAYQNIEEEIFKQDLGAGVVLYCGSAHLLKKNIYNSGAEQFEFEHGFDHPHDKRYKTIAYYLDKYKNGDVITIDISQNQAISSADISFDLQKKSIAEVQRTLLNKLDILLEGEKE